MPGTFPFSFFHFQFIFGKNIMTKQEQQEDYHQYNNNINEDNDNDNNNDDVTLKEYHFSDDYWDDASPPPPSPPPPPSANRVKHVQHLRKPVLSFQERLEQLKESQYDNKQESSDNYINSYNEDDNDDDEEQDFILDHHKEETSSNIVFDKETIFDTSLPAPRLSWHLSDEDDEDPSGIITSTSSASTSAATTTTPTTTTPTTTTITTTTTAIRKQRSTTQKRIKSTKRGVQRRYKKKNPQQESTEKTKTKNTLSNEHNRLQKSYSCSTRSPELQSPTTIQEKWSDPGRLRSRSKINGARQRRSSLLLLQENKMKLTITTTKGSATLATS
ncbi:hypothetical protein BDA99DRAFT_515367 [Phascolomyces articulosus]|uniref:Uncharacterized protein n=1 Tax=Phascolomyces articulosus TaxID=60185 RepID=A0AAD5PC41_9FUNG|nr:hypothetical protein BDA99DRAFT_515367 [Phascolomyces articulosus]